MGIDVINNVYTSLRIVWLKKRNNVDVNEQMNLLQQLAINELVEVLCPLAFTLSFVVAFLGPNSEVMGNVGSNLYHFQSVEDIEIFLGKIVWLYIADLSSLIIGAFVLWFFCRISLFTAIMAIEKEWTIVMYVTLWFNVVSVRY